MGNTPLKMRPALLSRQVLPSHTMLLLVAVTTFSVAISISKSSVFIVATLLL
jgi:hypothetical protein